LVKTLSVHLCDWTKVKEDGEEGLEEMGGNCATFRKDGGFSGEPIMKGYCIQLF
jgi:hypothetical protein